jgi:hypothetical protein
VSEPLGRKEGKKEVPKALIKRLHQGADPEGIIVGKVLITGGQV